MGAEVFYDADSTQSTLSETPDLPPAYEENECREKDYKENYEEDTDDEKGRLLTARPSPRSQSPHLRYAPTPCTPTRLDKLKDCWENIKNYKDIRTLVVVLVVLTLYFALLGTVFVYTYKHRNDVHYEVYPAVFDEVQACAIRNAKKDLSFLDTAKPIEAAEFLYRRDRLAKALWEHKVDAFVLEPGYSYNGQYYTNITDVDLEELEDQPVLMIISPQISGNGEVTATTTYLAPYFDEARVWMLNIPSQDEELDIVIWKPHENPYKVLRQSNHIKWSENPKVMMTPWPREFLVLALEASGFQIVRSVSVGSLDIGDMYQLKSPAEIEILRAVNTGTAAAIRAMRPCLKTGMSEVQVRMTLDQVLLAMGFELELERPNLVYFEDRGTTDEEYVGSSLNTTLDVNNMVYVRAHARYLGYSSLIARTFLIDEDPAAPAKYNPGDRHREDMRKIWQRVFDAQTAMIKVLKPGIEAGEVVWAARAAVSNTRHWDAFFSEGQGIGIRPFEAPFLIEYNKDEHLQAGMVLTLRPEIFHFTSFGSVSHGDVYLVKEDGEAELLNGQRARGLREP